VEASTNYVDRSCTRDVSTNNTNKVAGWLWMPGSSQAIGTFN
jgi:hypothetical protein